MKRFVLILVMTLNYLSTCFSQVESFQFKEGVEYFTYSGDTLVESKFVTKDSEVSDNLIVYLFNNFKYIGANKWKTNNNTITHYYKQDDEYIFNITRWKK